MYYLLMRNQLHRFAIPKTGKTAGQILYRVCSLLLCMVAVLVSGCSTTNTKSKPEPEEVHQRGWIGGEFKLARRTTAGDVFFGSADEHISTLPHGLGSSNRAGILITALSSNTPARQAGLRKGDLILACNHQPITTVKAFYQLLDRTEPGTSLPIAAWRDGKTLECNVRVGRETFKNWGFFTVSFALPRLPELDPRDLFPTPGFNLIALGYDPSPDDRKELGSAESTYLRACKGAKYEPSDRDWTAWLAIFNVAKGKNILSQESVPARTASLPTTSVKE
jgi:PDZ domain